MMLLAKNKLILFSFIFFLFFTISFLGYCNDDDDVNNPPVADEEPLGSLDLEEMTESTSDTRYTDEEFATLSDKEKKDIYFNFPQMLPENFNPDAYMHIFHPEAGAAENESGN
jgi:hypothetical protein